MTAAVDDILAEVEAMNVVADFPQLKQADRCDRCGAQAWVITLHLKGLLYWCKHHFEKHQSKLVSSGDDRKAIAIQDNRELINKAPSVSASL